MSELDAAGRSSLHSAAAQNRVDDIASGIARGEDINLGDRAGFTPLHMVAEHGSVDAARALLDRGAEVNKLNAYGNTPLLVAVFNSRGHGEMIALLRERGADPLKANRSGQTPVGLARLIGNYDVAQFFNDLPADRYARVGPRSDRLVAPREQQHASL